MDVLFNKKVVRRNMKRIQSKLHETVTYDILKISLSCFDDKRYILDDGIIKLAHFHKDKKFVNLIKIISSIRIAKMISSIRICKFDKNL